MSITQALINQISTADDARVLRALEALQSGSMTVEIRYNGGVLTAEVTSTVVMGKKKPVEKITTYTVLVAPGHSECSCPDWQYRRKDDLICKHQVAAAMTAQAKQIEEKQVA